MAFIMILPVTYLPFVDNVCSVVVGVYEDSGVNVAILPVTTVPSALYPCLPDNKSLDVRCKIFS